MADENNMSPDRTAKYTPTSQDLQFSRPEISLNKKRQPQSLGRKLKTGILGAFGSVLTLAHPAAAENSAPYCPPGQKPELVLGLKALSDAIKDGTGEDKMGTPLECEHTEVKTGDAHQQTDTGLGFYRKSTNTVEFTDGVKHYALTDQGLVSWEGESIDPPAELSQLPTGGGDLGQETKPAVEVGKKDIFGYVTQEDGSAKYGDLALGYEIIDETKGNFHVRIVPRTPQLEQQFREMAADNMKKNPVDNFPTRIRYLEPNDPRWMSHKTHDFIMGDETNPNASVKLDTEVFFYNEDNGRKIIEEWMSFDKNALTAESLNKVQDAIKLGTQVPLVLGGYVGYGPGITISDPAARVLLDQAPFTLAWGDFSHPETIQTLNPVSY